MVVGCIGLHALLPDFPVIVLFTFALFVSVEVVIFVEHSWNPFVDLQAMDRVHRSGWWLVGLNGLPMC